MHLKKIKQTLNVFVRPKINLDVNYRINYYYYLIENINGSFKLHIWRSIHNLLAENFCYQEISGPIRTEKHLNRENLRPNRTDRDSRIGIASL